MGQMIVIGLILLGKRGYSLIYPTTTNMGALLRPVSLKKGYVPPSPQTTDPQGPDFVVLAIKKGIPFERAVVRRRPGQILNE